MSKLWKELKLKAVLPLISSFSSNLPPFRLLAYATSDISRTSIL